MAIRVKHTNIIALAAAALLVAACQSDDVTVSNNEVQTEQTEISFGLDLTFPPDVITRGTNQLTNITMQGKGTGTGFGVFAVLTGDDYFTSDTDIKAFYLNNHRFEAEIVRDPETNDILPNPDYYGDPMAYWPRQGKLSFFCYAPHDPEMEQLTMHANPKGTLTFDYAPSPLPEKQLDLCLAKPALNNTVTLDAVPLNYQHVCSYITFYGRYKGSIPKKYDIVIDQIKINGIMGEGTLQYDIDPESDGHKWLVPSGNPNDYDSDKKTDYTLLRQNGTLQHLRNVALKEEDDANGNANYKLLQIYLGDLYLVPQILKGASLDVTFSYVEGMEEGAADGSTFGSSGTVIAQYERHIAIPDGTVWRPGKICNFNLTIQTGELTNVTLDVSSGGNIGITPWGDEDKNEDHIIE